MSNALEQQVGGDHYRSLSYQPVEFCCDVRASPILNHFSKYLVREKGDRKENLKKALHCIKLEHYMTQCYRTHPTGYKYPSDEVHLQTFCEQFGEELSDIYYHIFYDFMKGNYKSCEERLLLEEDVILENS